ncbi:MAG TPA: SDR family oxidoreductase [Vicinamibacterales bacterium]|nr:SDR family oxidoreductase [Vicinamibacterales bacterium]
MDLGLRGRVAVIAAASKGLGRAIADTFADEGAAVVLCARGDAALREACAAIEARGGRAHGVIADVAAPGAPAHVVAEAARVFGPVEIVVTNSGGPRSGAFELLSDEDWDHAVRTLLTSTVGFARAVLPAMRARRWGRILNVTSIAAVQPVDGLMLSNSVRSAVHAFAKTLSNEVAADGVTVNNLVPGYTRTDRVIDLARQMAASGGTTPADVSARWEAEIPMRRLGEPRELAALAAFLASDHAGYITGQSIAVDGGWIRSV